ncbi:molybdopterin converting factor subunit 1 [Sphingomonas donggukensis]|uniref:Molybdopterin synthase sulfur carrier subunit n=1 Tax=Sphingomonas donggukensis TaxID=2949093 RepID=A0ABY4TPR6_9SPHN|nr:molybdopterin converting factor subunit 1 [Sphingomonas donggukensis]URW74372.1 molybdopterin converting factor subunit 1 [Sphingomonas donggukensis]
MDVLYFAWVREAVGKGSENVAPPADVTTVTELLDWLARDSVPHATAFADRTRLRAAIDQQFVPLDALLAGAREVAIFPPVTGG